jgi:exodeoxyribonuclease VII large subunit
LSWLSPKGYLLRRQEQLLTLGRSLHRLSRDILRPKEDRLQHALGDLRRLGKAARLQRDLDRLTHLASRLQNGMRSLVQTKEHQLQDGLAAMSGLDPYLPLRRGYSLARLGASGEILRRAEQVHAGDLLEITAQEAIIRARVEHAEDRRWPDERAGEES